MLTGKIQLLFFGLVVLSAMGRAEAGKLVIAHYMTDMVPRTDQSPSPWLDPELADPQGSTAALGGLHQTLPMASLHLHHAGLEKAVDFEIRAARQLGVDGFQFYYPLGDDVQLLSGPYNRIIREFIRQSETKYPGFKVSICLAHPASEIAHSETDKIALWSQPVRELLAGTVDSPAWLRTDSGALLFYLWAGDRLADGVIHIAETPEQVRKVGAVYQQFSQAVGTSIDYVYQVGAMFSQRAESWNRSGGHADSLRPAGSGTRPCSDRA